MRAATRRSHVIGIRSRHLPRSQPSTPKPILRIVDDDLMLAVTDASYASGVPFSHLASRLTQAQHAPPLRWRYPGTATFDMSGSAVWHDLAVCSTQAARRAILFPSRCRSFEDPSSIQGMFIWEPGSAHTAGSQNGKNNNNDTVGKARPRLPVPSAIVRPIQSTRPAWNRDLSGPVRDTSPGISGSRGDSLPMR